MIYKKITQLVGKTPLMELSSYEKENNLDAKIIAKLEFMNPAGSVKDRVAVKMIEQAEKKGILKKGGIIIEPTSGNTGIGLAMCGAIRGYRVILTMPDTMSEERRKLLSLYGAELVLTEGALGMTGAIKKAEELLREIPDSYMPGQFTNEANSMAHYETTGPEICEDTDGEIDVFVATVGTGGTLTGTAKFLKEQKPDLYVVGVEPASSPLLSKGYAGSHGIQGIGANFIPEILDNEIYDEIIAVEDQDAFDESRLLAKSEGLLVGISSGAALSAAVKLAERPEFSGKRIVVLLPDTGERYLSVL